MFKCNLLYTQWKIITIAIHSAKIIQLKRYSKIVSVQNVIGYRHLFCPNEYSFVPGQI